MEKARNSIWIVSIGVLILAYLASIYRYIGIEGVVENQVLAAISALIFFIGVPMFIVRYVYKERMEEFGWRLPVIQRNKLLVVGVLVVHVVAAFVLSTLPAYATFYAVTGPMLLLTTILSLIYFCAEEFLFRGFMLFGLWERYRYVGIGVCVGVFALLHFAKAPGEIFIALASGTLLSVVALRTRSFIFPALIHFIFALTLNILVSFH